MSENMRTEHNESAQRYELYVDDELASLAEYRPDGDRLHFNHTETDARFRGKGLAEKVVRFALDDVRARNKTIVPACWFVAEFVRSNDEYADLVAA